MEQLAERAFAFGELIGDRAKIRDRALEIGRGFLVEDERAEGALAEFAGCLLGKKMCGERWGLLCSVFFTRKIFHAADRRDYELEKAVFLPVTSKNRFWGWG